MEEKVSKGRAISPLAVPAGTGYLEHHDFMEDVNMGLQIYAGKGFDTQKAERFFKERRISYQRVDVLKFGIGRRELESVAAAVGLDALCDKDSKAWRESVLAYTQNKETILAGLCEKPQLLKLPIVRSGRLATVGCCPDVWEKWIAEKKI